MVRLRYVEEALLEYSASQDRKLGNDMLARAAGPHVEVMEMLLAHGAEPSLIDKDGNTVDETRWGQSRQTDCCREAA